MNQRHKHKQSEFLNNAHLVETVIIAMTKLHNQSSKHIIVSFVDSDISPVAAYWATPANLANPENLQCSKMGTES